MKSKQYTIPIFIPHAGCSHLCSFCNQNKISGINEIPNIEKAKQTIEKYLQTFSKNSKIEIGFFGGSFTGLPIHMQETYLNLANQYLKKNLIHHIRLSTRPDYINQEIIDLLKKYQVTSIEIGAQSTNNSVLETNQRGHVKEDIKKASLQIKKAGFHLGLQMMVGLPDDSLQKTVQTAKDFIDFKADFVRIYPTLVIKNTHLQDLYLNKKYIPLSLDEAIFWCKEITLLFEKQKIPIIKMGLHPTSGLLNGQDLLAGPFHLSFRELVYTHIWQSLLKNQIKLNSHQEIEIEVSLNEINYAIGYSGKNKNWLNNYFKKVHFSTNKKLTQRNFNVRYC